MPKQPNILLIQCDQMTAHLTGVYGHPVVQTPSLNRLAEQGVRFNNAYSPCPVCVPARSAIMTGRYISRTGCYDNGCMFPSNMPTICHYLSIAGYETIVAGKMHFIGPDQLHGFERRLTTDFHPSDLSFLPPRPHEGLKEDAGFHDQPIAINYVTAGPRQWNIEMAYDDEVHFRALEYLASKRSDYRGSPQRDYPARDERPFFLSVSYTYPHEPFYPTQELWDLYEEMEIELPSIPKELADFEHPMDKMLNRFHGTHRVDLEDPGALYRMRRAYFALVTLVDRKVGELMQAIDNFGLSDNTIVLFISDHGDMLGERQMVQKRTFYEYSTHVPWLLSLPTRWRGGIVVDEPVSLVDVMPTILDCAGIAAESILPIDGRSVIPLIVGRREPERAVFSEMHSEGVTTTAFMVRQRNYKYIHVTGYPAQLYDLAEDPGEWRNLANLPDYQMIKDRLHALILDHFDPEAIERDVQVSQSHNWLIKEALESSTGSQWDYQPIFDARRQYWREG